MTITKDKIKYQPTNEVPAFVYEFIDTIVKIKNLDKVLEVCFPKKMSDIYVVTEEDDVELAETIMKKFAAWESSYKVFPELHIINKNEKFYIPDGANSI